jgi:alpha-glucosidase
VFIYQGQELGLEEVEIPDELRQDPIFFRTNGARIGRDGCRVPVPWSDGPPGFGFTTGSPWLPMPASWVDRSVDAQQGHAGSSLEFHRLALAFRRGSDGLREGSFAWRESPAGTLVFERRSSSETVLCAVNVDGEPLEVPEGRLLMSSEPEVGEWLGPGTAVWVRS